MEKCMMASDSSCWISARLRNNRTATTVLTQIHSSNAIKAILSQWALLLDKLWACYTSPRLCVLVARPLARASLLT